MIIKQRKHLQGLIDKREGTEHWEEANSQIIKKLTGARHLKRKVDIFVEANQRTKHASAEEHAEVSKGAEHILTKQQEWGMTNRQKEQLQGIKDRGEKGQTPRQKSKKRTQGYTTREKRPTGKHWAPKNLTTEGTKIPRQ